MPTPWRDRIWQEYRAGTLTRAARDVLLTLHTFRGTGGVAWPSHATLAERARCCTRTVVRALALARRLGLVEWCERRIRAGWRWLQSSNRYWFTVPALAVQAVMTARKTRTTPTDSVADEGRKISKQEAIDAMLRAAAALPDLLAARRLVIEQRRA